MMTRIVPRFMVSSQRCENTTACAPSNRGIAGLRSGYVKRRSSSRRWPRIRSFGARFPWIWGCRRFVFWMGGRVRPCFVAPPAAHHALALFEFARLDVLDGLA